MTINNNNNKPPVGGTPTANNNNTAENTINPAIIPMGPRSRTADDDGLDWLRNYNDLPGNVVVNRADIFMPGPDGNMRVMDTYTADQWHSKNEMERRYNQRYDGRYEPRDKGEGAGFGYRDDPDNFSNSGLKVRSTRNRGNNNNSSSSGLEV